MRLTLGLLPLPCRYSETITWVVLLYFLGRGVCVADTWITTLPCRYSETITVGEWVASIIFYW